MVDLPSLNKKHGISICSLKDMKAEKLPVISTGSLSLDLATNVGGYPRGRIIEIYGAESAGKSTMCAAVAKNGLTVAYLDVEGSFDPTFVARTGADTDNLIYANPETAEQTLGLARDLSMDGSVDVVVIDSIAALTGITEAEIAGKGGISSLARLMSTTLSKINGSLHPNTCLICVNQIREKVGIMFGNPETTPGGRALKFYASMRIELRQCGKLESSGKQYGIETQARVTKNKVASPFGVAKVPISWKHGVDKLTEIVTLGVQLEIIEKSGPWLSFSGDRLGQGVANARDMLEKTPDMAAVIEEAVRKAIEAP